MILGVKIEQCLNRVALEKYSWSIFCQIFCTFFILKTLRFWFMDTASLQALSPSIFLCFSHCPHQAHFDTYQLSNFLITQMLIRRTMIEFDFLHQICLYILFIFADTFSNKPRVKVLMSRAKLINPRLPLWTILSPLDNS